MAEYGCVGLRALAEVEAALTAVFTGVERARILERAAASDACAVQLAQVRYRVGSGDLRGVM